MAAGLVLDCLRGVPDSPHRCSRIAKQLKSTELVATLRAEGLPRWCQFCLAAKCRLGRRTNRYRLRHIQSAERGWPPPLGARADAIRKTNPPPLQPRF